MYADQQDMIDRFGSDELIQLTDRTNRPQSTIDASVVGLALSDADALIDSYVGKRYTLPLSSIPDRLVKVACDIARFYLHGKAAEKDDPVYLAHKAALDWLKDVSAGVVKLDADGITPAQSGGGQVRVSTPGRVFTRESLRGGHG